MNMAYNIIMMDKTRSREMIKDMAMRDLNDELVLRRVGVIKLQMQPNLSRVLMVH